MLRHLDTFERALTYTLLFMLAGVVLLAIVELAWIIGKDIMSSPIFLPGIEELLGLFGQFLLVLIGLELIHSVKVYIEHRVVHLEAVLAVAIIAVARKVVVLEPKELPEGTLLGIAALALALSIGYFLVQRSRREEDPTVPKRAQ
ncbi:MAG: phosphate-starvation-inducible PsiE family protein [Burkholderiales bacterium]|nr:phosphate-starvation-inducible PsiE family protein [Burkholderiales bacterium]